MKYLSVALLVVVGTLVTATVSQAETKQGADLLQTHPVSVNQGDAGRIRIVPYKSQDLNNATSTLQANPPKPAEKSPFPPNLIPDSMKQPTPQPSVNPLEFFQVPALDGGVKVKVGS